jgi:hypothetical protein
MMGPMINQPFFQLTLPLMVTIVIAASMTPAYGP